MNQRAPVHHRDVTCEAADIQFVRGVNEPSVPEVKLTRSRDGSNGTATFVFAAPSIFEASSELGDITGNRRHSFLIFWSYKTFLSYVTAV